MRKAIYPGSFDPTTWGHLHTLEQAAKIFDAITVVIGTNPAKKHLLGENQRAEIFKKALPSISDKVSCTFEIAILPPNEYLIDLASRIGATSIVRGVRTVADFEYETMMARTNAEISGGTIQTVFLTPPPHLIDVSSSIVKMHLKCSRWRDYIGTYVPEAAIPYLEEAVHGN